MGANFRPETLAELVGRGNVAVRCACGHRAVIDGPKLSRYFMAHIWDGRLHMVQDRLRCTRCRGKRVRLGLTFDLPTGPEWGPCSEREWKELVCRLRG